MKYKFSKEDRDRIEKARKDNRDKQTEKRLCVLSMRCEGKTLEEISKAGGFHRSHVCNLIRKYFEEGLTAVSEKHYTGNRRNMSIEEEAAFLKPYQQRAESGQLLDVREMAAAYEKRLDTVLVVDRSIGCCGGITGEKLCREASIQRKPAKRSLRPQKN